MNISDYSVEALDELWEIVDSYFQNTKSVRSTSLSKWVMKVTRKSPISGKEHTLDLPITQEQLDRLAKPGRTEKIQDIFPNLSDGEREFLLTGITDEEWHITFKDEEKEAEKPKITIIYNTYGEHVGTAYEFFSNEEKAKARYEELKGLNKYPVMRPYNDKDDHYSDVIIVDISRVRADKKIRAGIEILTKADEIIDKYR